MGSSVSSSLPKVRSRSPFLGSTASWAILTAVLCANPRASRAFTCCSGSFGMHKHDYTRHKHTRLVDTKQQRQQGKTDTRAGMAGEFGWLGWKKVKTHRKLNNNKGVIICSLYWKKDCQYDICMWFLFHMWCFTYCWLGIFIIWRIEFLGESNLKKFWMVLYTSQLDFCKCWQ